jgi:hypothetical protein
MRRGFQLLAALLLAVLAAGPAVAARGSSKRPVLRYQLTFSGRLLVSHSDQGLQANGAGCNLGPDDTSPFVDDYTLSLRWSTTFNVTLKRKLVQVMARATRVTGGQYSYQGYAYDFNCNEIIYGPGGQPCTGTLAVGGRAVLTARGSPTRKPKRLTFGSEPFGPLVATPPECTVDASPAVTYAAADELSLASLGQTIAHTFSARVVKRPHTYRFTINTVNDCSQPAQSPGETDTCSTTYAGSGSLRVRPR